MQEEESLSTRLALRGVTKSYGERLVPDQVGRAVRPGERLGVVGENGSRKSTLLRLLAGTETPDTGEVTVAAPGHLGQRLDLSGGHTVRQVVDTALAELRAMERYLRALEAELTEERLPEYSELLTAFEARGGYEADARVDKALYALGLGTLDRGRWLGGLSGGERARLGLACLLAAAHDPLLLDEPPTTSPSPWSKNSNRPWTTTRAPWWSSPTTEHSPAVSPAT
ncbi:ATP-binding cassette domain-containing protein [Streptomyces sp. NPDC058045]|uniref:ATP-binding cassette domain-containing protein n=1 Tax=Streptomyces sp. NPDC058045 TaxID=3346311 RepID=UPI0036E481C0